MVADEATSLTVTVRVMLPDGRSDSSLPVSGLNQATCHGRNSRSGPMWTPGEPDQSAVTGSVTGTVRVPWVRLAEAAAQCPNSTEVGAATVSVSTCGRNSARSPEGETPQRL